MASELNMDLRVNMGKAQEDIRRGVPKLKEEAGKGLPNKLPGGPGSIPLMPPIRPLIPPSGALKVPPIIPVPGATGALGGASRILGVVSGVATKLAGLSLVLGPLSIAFTLLVAAAHKLIEVMVEGAKKGHEMYAKALSAGGGAQFTARRSAIADALGVSEKDVYRFGEATAMVGAKTRVAAGMVAKATPELASLYVEFAALNQLFQALKMTIAAELSPTIRQLLMLFRILSYGMLEGFKLLMEVAKKLPAIFANAIFGQAGMILVEILQKMLGAFSQSTKLPEPSASPSRGAGLGFSQWEKMGLVISGPSRNWAEVTARNTGRTATAVEKMAGNKEKPKPAEMSLSYQQAP